MDKVSQIALSLLPGLGPVGCRKLLDVYPEQDIFALPAGELKMAFGGHERTLRAILAKSTHARAEHLLRDAERGGVQVLFFTDDAYPQRLNRDEAADCPVVLYMYGTADLNAERSLSVVGTRRATQEGRNATDRLVSQLQPLGLQVVSGLAYGIDTVAHTAALSCGLPTVAVLGHGLDRIYPPENRGLAKRIVEEGGALVTEYPIGTAISARNFPARNRIIAALSDATLVVEASERGGALITAAIAAGYHRELFAVPGRLSDTYSCGTNNLIATHKALMVRHADDITFHMGWPSVLSQAKARQQSLFPTLDADASRVVDHLREQGPSSLDEMASAMQMSLSKVAGILFELEMQRLVRTLPGHIYQLIEK